MDYRRFGRNTKSSEALPKMLPANCYVYSVESGESPPEDTTGNPADAWPFGSYRAGLIENLVTESIMQGAWGKHIDANTQMMFQFHLDTGDIE